MNDVLFAEDLQNSNTYKKQLKYVLSVGLISVVLGMVFAIFMLLEGDRFMAIYTAAVVLLAVGLFAVVNLFPKRYIYVYSDRIVCKKGFLKEQTVVCSPSEYTLKIQPVYAKNARMVKLVFVGKDGKAILKYRSALVAKSYSDLKSTWEYDVTKIGCKIIDETWEIIK